MRSPKSREAAVSNQLRIVAAGFCFLTVVSSASAQRRFASSSQPPQPQACESARAAFQVTNCLAAGSMATEPRVEVSDSTKSHTFLGIVVGAVAGGAIAIGANRVIHGKCDEPDDSIIN